MKRIEPTHFIEVFKSGRVHCQHALPMKLGEELTLEQLGILDSMPGIAIFLIKPQTTSLAERMEARRKEKDHAVTLNDLLNSRPLFA